MVVSYTSMDTFLCPWMEEGKEEVGKDRETGGEGEGERDEREVKGGSDG